MSLDDTKQECQRVADDEVRGFMELQVGVQGARWRKSS